MSSFELLHPALQHHIVNSLGWKELRPFQETAIPSILQGEHAIILAPTAGGKTECVVFPLLSRMLSEPWQGLSVLYVCPIKALINDLGQRLERYATLVGRRACIWHGDVSAGQRARMLKDPPDVLLTTPESIEVMLTSSRVESLQLLGRVQAVVVDEIHAFAADDRGCHLAALLSRLVRLTGREFQRVGLSATVGNPEFLAEWLTGDANAPSRVLLPEPKAGPQAEVKLDYVGSLENAGHVLSRLYRGQKRLVFVDSRARAEKLADALRRSSVRTFVTHSSLSRSERHRAEDAFHNSQDSVIVATSALELGVDVGDLDRVVQIDSPGTVSSFLQRMGRTGRRSGGQRNCLFLATRESALLRAAGIIQLFEKGYVEPVEPPAEPYHVLAQQLMALVLQENGIGRDSWREWLEGASFYDSLDHQQTERVVSWMVRNEILFDDQGILGIGAKGETLYGRRNFMELFSVFSSPPVLTVQYGREELGYIDERIVLWQSGEDRKQLLLGGRTWSVQHVDWTGRRVFVEPTDTGGGVWWPGEPMGLGFELCQAIRETLASEEVPSTWSRRATQKLNSLRADFAWLDPERASTLVSNESGFDWWTFAGDTANTCLAVGLGDVLKVMVKHDDMRLCLPSDLSCQIVVDAIEELKQFDWGRLRPPVQDDAIQSLKFSDALPPDLAQRVLQSRLTAKLAITHALVDYRVVYAPE